MRLLPLFVAMAVGMTGLVGCAKVLSAQDLAGTWSGKLDLADDAILKQLKAAGKTEKDLPAAKKELAGSPAVPLELKKDMTYTLGEGAGSAQGTWTFESSKLTLTITSANGKKVEDLVKEMPALKDQLKPMVFDVDKEGKNAAGDVPGAIPGMKIKFSKSDAKSEAK